MKSIHLCIPGLMCTLTFGNEALSKMLWSILVGFNNFFHKLLQMALQVALPRKGTLKGN